MALGKHGLGKRDVVPNVNFFVARRRRRRRARCAGPGNSRPGASVELRFEMETLVVLSNTPHPLDPAPQYQPPPVELSISDGPPAPPTTLPAVAAGKRARLPAYRRLRRGDGRRTMSSFRMTESALDPAAAAVDVTLPAGQGWTQELASGDDLPHRRSEGNQAVDTLFFNAATIDERYSATETIRAQGNIYLTTGTPLMSAGGSRS